MPSTRAWRTAQSLIDAARSALEAVSGGESDAGSNAEALAGSAIDALQHVAPFDARLEATIESLRGAEAQLRDAAHTLASYLDRAELDPERLRALDERLSAWVALARRYRRPPAELPALLAEWKTELRALDAAADLDGLRSCQRRRTEGLRQRSEARLVAAAQRGAETGCRGHARDAAARHGRRSASRSRSRRPSRRNRSASNRQNSSSPATPARTPRPLGKVASGGELSRIALSVAVVTSELDTGSEAPAR